MSSYGRASLLGKPGPRARRSPTLNAELLAHAVAQLNKVGSNLNQIARVLNAWPVRGRARSVEKPCENARGGRANPRHCGAQGPSMIGKGTQHNNGAKLATYLITGKENETRTNCASFAVSHRTISARRFARFMSWPRPRARRSPSFTCRSGIRRRDADARAMDARRRPDLESKLGSTDQPRAIAFHRDEEDRPRAYAYRLEPHRRRDHDGASHCRFSNCG